MSKWNHEEIDFEGCLTVSQTIEKYLKYKKDTPKEFIPCLDWWFFAKLADEIQWDLYDQYRKSLDKLG
ncbi:hypothetical protein [Turicibacter sanguinis]|uniref:hypothetical protein n=1 Tax=Turicibacter sanguinis TaxID=154288 RepID=UPI0018AA44DB|nr:hypothetical protein [Turicibacter sanguinis]MDB8552143.1 hypothetical protein [Turicibacter sanguinis]